MTALTTKPRLKLSDLMGQLVEAGRELERTEGRLGRPEVLEEIRDTRRAIFVLFDSLTSAEA